MSKPYYWIILFALPLVLLQCRRPAVNDLGWETELLLPVAQGELTIQDIVDTAWLRTDGDGALSLVYAYPLYTLRLSDEYIDVPDTSYADAVSLDSLFLPNQTIDYPVTLGQLARNDPSGQGQLLIFFHGNFAPIPAINNLSSTDAPIDATTFFESAEIESGFMDVTIKNDFPVDITDLSFVLKNASDGSAVIGGTIPLVAAGATESRSYSLQGKEVEGQLLADIDNLSTPGSTGTVLIDTNDALALTITVRDLTLRNARAIFPAQNLINVQNQTTYNMGGPAFTFMKLRSGELRITAFNTIEDSLFLEYSIPTARGPNNEPIDIRTVVNPASPNSSEKVDLAYDLSNYTIDLKSIYGDRVNTFDNLFRVSIDSSGKLIYISLDDSVSVSYGLVDIIPEYVKGYMGQRQLQVGPTVTPLAFFEQITGGQLNVDQLTANLVITNPFGVDGLLEVVDITGRNMRTGESVALQAPFIGQGVAVERGFENPKRPGVTTLPLDEQNSNIKALLSVLPSELTYNLRMNINPNGNFYNYQDFAYFDDALTAALELELPLDIDLDALTLSQTSPFDLFQSATAERIQSGTLRVQVENAYPIDAQLQVYFLDNQQQVIDSLLVTPGQIAAGQLLPDQCRVTTAQPTRLEVPLSAEKMAALQTATSIRFDSRFTTTSLPNCGDFVRLYDDYFMAISITGTLTYAVGE